jgi:DNA-binding CsgD family transcriptional regulator
MHRLHVAVEALGLIGLAAGIIQRDRHVLALNKLLEALTHHVNWLPQRRLAMVDAKINDQFAFALGAATRPHTMATRIFTSRPRGQEPAVVHMVHAWRLARDLAEERLAMIVISPVTPPRAPDIVLICSLFGLSPGEARVACAIAQGRTVIQIAAESGVSRETVRTQVKAILAKTGTNRQAEMALLLAGLPRFVEPVRAVPGLRSAE